MEQTKKNTLLFEELYRAFCNRGKEGSSVIEECTFFIDKMGEPIQCNMKYSKLDPSAEWELTCYDKEGNECANLCVIPQSGNRFLIEQIYVYKAYRNRGIARCMIELLEFMLRDYATILLRGTFYPYQNYVDSLIPPFLTPSQIKEQTRHFYEHMNFQLVHLSDYLAHPQEYPEVDEVLDFHLSGEKDEMTTVLKVITHKKEYPFQKVGNVYYHDNALAYTHKMNQMEE